MIPGGYVIDPSPKTVVFDALKGKRDGRLLGEPICRPSRPAPPRPASPPAVRRPAPTRPWYVRGLDSTGANHTRENNETTPAEPNLSTPKPRHTTGGSGWRGARRWGRAKRGGAGRDASGSVSLGSNLPTGPPRHRRQLP